MQIPYLVGLGFGDYSEEYPTSLVLKMRNCSCYLYNLGIDDVIPAQPRY